MRDLQTLLAVLPRMTLSTVVSPDVIATLGQTLDPWELTGSLEIPFGQSINSF